MKEEGWFWSHEELVYENYSSTLGFDVWAPPAPFGVTVAIYQVHWGAVKNGLSTAIAMSFLYLIRCSVYVAYYICGFVSCQKDSFSCSIYRICMKYEIKLNN